ncbi:MAG: TrkA family potassium uptake protein [Clostridia bacterium]|nr:TrkA family potassium uptake protein [Clostridia bacterium]MCL6521317.1 TrkA family potassium uptake protein [Bacillota bacterium]
MRIIVVGCGRTGRRLARAFAERGDEVTVVDRRTAMLEQLAELPGVHVVAGLGFDQEVLRRAGAAEADLLVAATENDNANLMVADVAHLLLGTRRVLLIVNDAEGSEIYQRFGYDVIVPVELGVQKALLCAASVAGQAAGSRPEAGGR